MNLLKEFAAHESIERNDRSLARLYTLRHDTINIVYNIDKYRQHMDVPSMALLPELMYAGPFPGETALLNF